MNELAKVITEDSQIDRAVNNYLHATFNDLKGKTLTLDNGTISFNSPTEFFEFMLSVSREGIQIIELDEVN